MLAYMLDTIICIYVMKTYPPTVREKFNVLAERLCISSITLGELHYDAEKSARRGENLTAIDHFTTRLEVLPFGEKAAAHYGQLRAELERAGTPWALMTCRSAARPQRGADRGHQQHARVYPGAGCKGRELAIATYRSVSGDPL
jgi:tRNA(fMet)-specific endonuclease VapC